MKLKICVGVFISRVIIKHHGMNTCSLVCVVRLHPFLNSALIVARSSLLFWLLQPLVRSRRSVKACLSLLETCNVEVIIEKDKC